MIPFEYQVWDAQECANYLIQERSTFLKRTQFSPGFPPRLPMQGQPRWMAKEVHEWAIFGGKKQEEWLTSRKEQMANGGRRYYEEKSEEQRALPQEKKRKPGARGLNGKFKTSTALSQ